MKILSFLGSVFKRSAVSNEDDDRYWSPFSGWIGKKSKAGITVNPQGALALSAYYACIRCLGEDLAKMPLVVFKDLGAGSEPDSSNPLYPILKYQANPETTAFTFRETMTAWAAGWGNGYAEIIRDGGGAVRELWLIHPSRVTLRRNTVGALRYYVREGASGSLDEIEYQPSEIFHLHGLGDGCNGWSIAQIGAESLGIGLAQQEYAGAFYGNGTSIGGVLKFPNKLDEKARTNLRESWQARHGGATNAHKTAVLEEGGEYQATTVNPKDAQFLEGRQFQVEEICRWFRIPPHKVQHLLRATFSNIEHSNIDYVTDTLIPWAVRWEQEIQIKLLGIDKPSYAKHNFQSQMRGDNAARAAFYSQLFQVGVFSADDIRRLEDLPIIGGPAGSAHFVQGALMPIETQLKAAAPGTAPKPAEQPKTKTPESKPSPADEEQES